MSHFHSVELKSEIGPHSSYRLHHYRPTSINKEKQEHLKSKMNVELKYHLESIVTEDLLQKKKKLLVKLKQFRQNRYLLLGSTLRKRILHLRMANSKIIHFRNDL